MSNLINAPWHVYAGGNFVRVVPEGYEDQVAKTSYLGGAVCTVDDWDGQKHNSYAPHVMARAKLIAEAPEMHNLLAEAVIFLTATQHQPASHGEQTLEDIASWKSRVEQLLVRTETKTRRR